MPTTKDFVDLSALKKIPEPESPWHVFASVSLFLAQRRVSVIPLVYRCVAPNNCV